MFVHTAEAYIVSHASVSLIEVGRPDVQSYFALRISWAHTAHDVRLDTDFRNLLRVITLVAVMVDCL